MVCAGSKHAMCKGVMVKKVQGAAGGVWGKAVGWQAGRKVGQVCKGRQCVVSVLGWGTGGGGGRQVVCGGSKVCVDRRWCGVCSAVVKAGWAGGVGQKGGVRGQTRPGSGGGGVVGEGNQTCVEGMVQNLGSPPNQSQPTCQRCGG